MTSTLSKGTLGSVVSLLAATHYQGNPDRNHKLWNIVSTERHILQMGVTSGAGTAYPSGAPEFTPRF
jgi:hypothetical protein